MKEREDAICRGQPDARRGERKIFRKAGFIDIGEGLTEYVYPGRFYDGFIKSVLNTRTTKTA